MTTVRRFAVPASLLVLGACAIAWRVVGHAGPGVPEGPVVTVASPFTDPHAAQATVSVFCAGCHSSGRSGLDLDGPVDVQHLRRERASWARVAHKLRTGQMPPRRQPQPSAEERQALIDWIEQAIRPDGELADFGPLRVRRLQRSEYANTIRDLVGVTFQPAADFPQDDNGWDRCRELPPLPAALADKYLAAASSILEQANLATWARPPAPTEADQARALLAAFAGRAYRRPALAGEVQTLLAIYESAAGAGAGFDSAVKVALKAVLTSPHFLYRVEIAGDPTVPSDVPVQPQFVLASRLSYFLWSSMPDQELLAQAGQGTLHRNLDSQVARMLKDPRAQALARDFTVSWLGVDNSLAATDVPEALRDAMRQEAELFVAHIFQADRSVLEFLDADYTFLNERLALHYGIAGVRGEAMRRVALVDSRRGGLLTQANFLVRTSFGGETSPVSRGKWVLDNILGTPPPPPPRGLLEAFQNTKKAFAPDTARKNLELHRADPSCAACHAKMDAIGFALENFDAAGAWRTRHHGRPIDPAVTFPEGVSVANPAQLKAYIVGQKELFVRCLSGKLLGHALGRKLESSDFTSLEHVAARVARGQHRFSSVILEVVHSAPFQMGTGPADRSLDVAGVLPGADSFRDCVSCVGTQPSFVISSVVFFGRIGS